MFAATAAAGGAVLGYALWEARRYTLRRATLSLRRRGMGAPRDLPALRILHLSDLHLAPRDRDRMRWIQSLATLQPDLVVVTGDFHGHADAGRLALTALRPLMEAPGLFVHGSNDFFSPRAINPAKYCSGPSKTIKRVLDIDLGNLDPGLAQAGWIGIDNVRCQLTVSGWRIAAKGCGDAHMQADSYADVAGPYPSADLRLAVTHAPYRRVLDAMVADDPDLVLAGHTHGGQIALPFFGALVTNCDLPRNQAKGLSQWQGVPLHVSAGLGTNPYTPIRVACRPEATLLTILPGE
jgi:predicted MPP superfamily phosphohydrolase